MKSIILLSIIFLLTACGSLHKTVNKEETKTDLTTKVDSSISTAINTLIDTKKGITTITTEKVDKVVTIPASTVTVARPLTELIDKGVLEASNGETSITMTYDPTTGTVRATGKSEAKKVPVKADKMIYSSEDYKSTTKQNIEEEKQASSLQTDKSSSESKDVKIDKEPNYVMWTVWLAIFGFLFYVLFLGLKYLR